MPPRHRKGIADAVNPPEPMIPGNRPPRKTCSTGPALLFPPVTHSGTPRWHREIIRPVNLEQYRVRKYAHVGGLIMERLLKKSRPGGVRRFRYEANGHECPGLVQDPPRS